VSLPLFRVQETLNSAVEIILLLKLDASFSALLFHHLPLMLKIIFILQLGTVYHQLTPRLMQTVRALVVTDEERAVEAMELFDDLVESAPVVIVPSIKPLVDMCLEFASNKTLGDGIRVKALSFIGWLTRTKKKVG
jgi:hypothetical protein